MTNDTQHRLQLIDADLTNGAFDAATDEVVRFLLQTIEGYRDEIESLEYAHGELQDQIDMLEEDLRILEGNAA